MVGINFTFKMLLFIYIPTFYFVFFPLYIHWQDLSSFLLVLWIAFIEVLVLRL